MLVESSRSTPIWLRCVIGLLIAFAVTQSIERGPYDLRHGVRTMMCDFNMLYSATTLWMVGANPYDNALLYSTWEAQGGNPDVLMPRYWVSVLPPGTFLILSPLALLPAPIATFLWLCMLWGMLALLLRTIIQLTHLRGWQVWTFIALALASAPVHALITLGQTSLPVILLTILAIAADRRGRRSLAGVMLGVAICIKPQIAGPFLVYFVVCQRWRVALVAIAAFSAITMLAIGRIHLAGHEWLHQWMHNIASTSVPGANDDPTLMGPWRHQMIHLPAWLFTFIEDPVSVRIMSWTICLTLGSGFLVLLLQVRDQPRKHMLALSVLCALTLLPVYHKSYDAGLLLLPAAWALRRMNFKRIVRVRSVLLLVILGAFMIPWDGLPLLMSKTGALDGIAQTLVWRVVIFPHHALATLGASIELLAILYVSIYRPELSRRTIPGIPRAGLLRAAKMGARG